MAKDPDSELVNSVGRALALLDAFTIDDASLGLAELSRRAQLPKTSALRLARSLAAHGYLTAVEGGAWRLGPATAWLGARYQVAFDIHNIIEPVMRELGHATRHSISYFVHDGDSRIRLLHVPGESAGGRRVRVGEPMPLDKGSPGQVLLAFSGKEGKLYDEIRKRGYHLTIGEANKGSASVAAPVFGARWNVLGALSIGVFSSTATQALLRAYAPGLMKAAEKLSRALTEDKKGRQPLAMARATWHPE
ncbi:MAG: IclR family transcriptional regulator [Pseudomonadota bacterium]